MSIFTAPATSPFAAAISTGSPAEIFRVRLLSMPQARQAAITATDPQEMKFSPYPALKQ
jgi:hypothetical protein